MTKNKIYGYIRVSSTDQNEERQLVAMRAAQATFYRRLREYRLANMPGK